MRRSREPEPLSARGGQPREDRHLFVDGALEDELGAESLELAQPVGTADPIEQARLAAGTR